MRLSLRGFSASLLAFALGLAPAAALGQVSPEPTRRPFLWRIAGEPPSYLYGTLHLPDERVLALPPVVIRALDRAQVFCAEVRMDEGGLRQMALAVLLPDGQTLDGVLPPELYQRVDRFVLSKGVPMPVFERMKIWAVATNLGVLDYFRQGVERRPVLDQYLYRRAQAAGKQLDALERIEDQIGILDSVDRPGQIAMLEQTLEHLERIEPGAPGPVEKLIVAYLSGDGERLLRTGLEYADLDDPQTARFLDALIDRRNRTMAAAIDERLGAASGLSYFFAPGSLHLPGPEGLVSLLTERGYALERLPLP